VRVPRGLSSTQLIKLLSNFDYEITRQTGSHIRLTTQSNGQHHITIPAHDPLKIGTLNAILRGVAEHLGLTKDEFLEQMFGER
jgi:predicted RNA binding protein YcfA (HicA-like mRNA interferase family)